MSGWQGGVSAPLTVAAHGHDRDMRCPRDQTPLTVRDLHGTTVGACAHCGGLWVQRQHLERLKPLRRQPVPGVAVVDVEAPIHCSIDATAMRRVRIDGVSVDVCPSCQGVWFDHGEIDRLVPAARKEPLSDRIGGHVADGLDMLSVIDSIVDLSGLAIEAVVNTIGDLP